MIKAFTIWNSAKLALHDEDDSRYSLARFCDALNEAMSDFTNRIDYFVDSTFVSVPPNYNQIDMGERAVKIIRVEYSDPPNTTTYKLNRIGYEDLDKDFRSWRSELNASQPRYFVVNRQNVCQFFVYPLARLEETPTGTFGILAVNDSQLNPTNDFGVITGLNKPYLQIFFSERQERVVPNADNTDIVFEGTTTSASFKIQEDVLHCLKHYCISVMTSDSNEQNNPETSKRSFAIYARKLEQIRQNHIRNYTSDVGAGIQYNNGFNNSGTVGRPYDYGIRN